MSSVSHIYVERTPIRADTLKPISIDEWAQEFLNPTELAEFLSAQQRQTDLWKDAVQANLVYSQPLNSDLTYFKQDGSWPETNVITLTAPSQESVTYEVNTITHQSNALLPVGDTINCINHTNGGTYVIAIAEDQTIILIEQISPPKPQAYAAFFNGPNPKDDPVYTSYRNRYLTDPNLIYEPVN